jgi:hypothetical protein
MPGNKKSVKKFDLGRGIYYIYDILAPLAQLVEQLTLKQFYPYVNH